METVPVDVSAFTERRRRSAIKTWGWLKMTVQKKGLKKILIGCLIVLLAAAVLALSLYLVYRHYYTGEVDPVSTASADIDRDFYPLELIAHRGFSGFAPENTLAAVKAAADADYSGTEFDVRPTKDGQWVVLHDNDVSRMTDGEGLVSEMTFEEVRALTIDAGSNVEQFPNEKIPTLAEMLDACAQYGIRPVIEIKAAEEGQTPDYRTLAGLITEKGAGDCMVISFSREALLAVKPYLPEAELWLLTNKVTDDAIAFCEENQLTGIDFSLYKIPNLFKINKIADHDLLVAAWTTDNIPMLEALCKRGVFIVTTNRLMPA